MNAAIKVPLMRFWPPYWLDSATILCFGIKANLARRYFLVHDHSRSKSKDSKAHAVIC